MLVFINSISSSLKRTLIKWVLCRFNTWRYWGLFSPFSACYFLMVVKVDIGHHPAVWRLILMALSDNIIIII